MEIKVSLQKVSTRISICITKYNNFSRTLFYAYITRVTPSSIYCVFYVDDIHFILEIINDCITRFVRTIINHNKFKAFIYNLP